jgi:tetratricopeptide (TPR) repeat protein
MANLRWSSRATRDGFELFRLAACLNDKDESAARTYFNSARFLNESESALAFLKGRFQRYSKRSCWPAISVHWALERLGRRAEAEQILAAAVKDLPEDGSLHLFAAEVESSRGRKKEAEEHLHIAEHKVAEARWLRTKARIAAGQRNAWPAVELWRKILERDPLAMDAHQEITALLSQIQGRVAAIKHLENACKEHPSHFGLHYLLFQYSAAEAPNSVGSILERLLALNPAHGAVRCAWARYLLGLGKREEALEQCDVAAELEPSNPASYTIRGIILRGDGKRAEAEASFRKAISVAVEYDYGTMLGLLQCCTTIMERRLALNFLRTELTRHLIFGDGLLAFRELLARHFEPNEVLTIVISSGEDDPVNL